LYAETETLRFKFVKKNEFKYLSHLDLIRIISRAAARAGLKLAYSKGFNPKPRMSFSNPTPLGVESLAEYCDMELQGGINAEEFMGLMNKALPEYLYIVKAKIIGENVLKLMSEISLVLYQFNLRLQEIKNKSYLKIKEKTSTEDKNLSDKNLDLSGVKETLKKDFENEVSKIYEIFNSIYNFSFSIEEDNVIVLKIFGYAKIFKEKNNLIFKFNNFLSFFNDFTKKYQISIELFKKVEMYLYLNSADKLVTPLDLV